MVNLTLHTPLWKRFVDGVRQDFIDFESVNNSRQVLETGIYTYKVARPDGGSMRIHLRIESGGTGVLFVDVTDVIHLNPTAAIMAKMALDNVSIRVANAIILGKYQGVSESQVEEELGRIYQMVDHFREHTGDCYTCALTGLLDMAPLFSIPVNAPYKVDIALTYGCNNECPHCYNEANRFQMPSLPLQDWFEVLDKIAFLGIPHVILTGGEATLHPSLPQIIHYADQLGMIVGLNTNGRHVAFGPYLQKLVAAGLNHIQVTLGSNYPEIHNVMMGAKSFDQTVRGIESGLLSGIHVITNTTLIRSNMGHVEEIIEFIYDLGIRTFAMNGMIYSGGGFAHPNAIPEEELSPLLVRVRDQARWLGMRFLWYTPTEYCRLSPVELEIGAKRCNAGEYSLCIEPNGDVLPCQSYYVSPGNILHDPWEKIWNNDILLSFREREKDPRQAGLPEKCWDCPDLPVCGGGCRIEREAREGIRVADLAGGGCAGCSGYAGKKSTTTTLEVFPTKSGDKTDGGFVPFSSQKKTTKRSSGDMPLVRVDGDK